MVGKLKMRDEISLLVSSMVHQSRKMYEPASVKPLEAADSIHIHLTLQDRKFNITFSSVYTSGSILFELYHSSKSASL